MPLACRWTVIVEMLLDNRFVHWKCPAGDYDRHVFVGAIHLRCHHRSKMFGNCGNTFGHWVFALKSETNGITSSTLMEYRMKSVPFLPFAIGSIFVLQV